MPDEQARRIDVRDRRPIRLRRLAVFHALAAALARRSVAPNAISMGGMLAAGVAGLLLAMTNATAISDRWLFVGAAALIQLRLLCNLLDGMVAIEGGLKSPTGDLFNEAPDRISDVAILLGAGYAAGSSPLLGAITALSAVFVAYLRVFGCALGLPGDFRGPMAKQQRMFILTLVCAAMAALPESLIARMSFIDDDGARGPVWLGLLVIVAGCAVTAARRLKRMVALLHETQHER